MQEPKLDGYCMQYHCFCKGNSHICLKNVSPYATDIQNKSCNSWKNFSELPKIYIDYTRLQELERTLKTSIKAICDDCIQKAPYHQVFCKCCTLGDLISYLPEGFSSEY